MLFQAHLVARAAATPTLPSGQADRDGHSDRHARRREKGEGATWEITAASHVGERGTLRPASGPGCHQEGSAAHEARRLKPETHPP